MHSLKKIVLIGFLVNSFLLTACDSSATADDAPPKSGNAEVQSSENSETEGQFDYQLRTEEASVLDDRFPFGNWEVTRIYPEVLSESHPMVADAVNARIAARIDQYRCDGLGDQSFKTQEVYLGKGLLSMAYQAIWMCASMPSPESEYGFLNLDLTDGTELNLEAQFRGPSAYAQFRNLAIRELNHALEEQVGDTEQTCPEVSAFNGFHTDGKALIVSSLSPEHGETFCDVEVEFPLESLSDKLRRDSPLRLAAQN